ncbi:DUF1338 domain-containing protein [Alginatibacterium sediminis]|uniref:2-oxoadipate dioxygenase/decarboxylase n=1 Tax=Alginatibacterium sediminis TaxID=2164068 RepID=A0A420EL18_9ALTE|nr:DUF1338 domain-containing protein [Alginatibacterium sediminis]RKF21330.1 DUF1338 domain-containing protein [Alginatibacterium sediminis]
MQQQQIFDALWHQYLKVTPSAQAIHQLLGHGHEIINDHIALRTLNLPGMGEAVLGQHFIDAGFKQADAYHFESKKLRAHYYLHPDPKVPKVFISELCVDLLSEQTQALLAKLLQNFDVKCLSEPSVLWSGRAWEISFTDYQALLNESEYAAWFAAWGYRANHFTVNVNQLPNFDSLEQVNTALKAAGYQLNVGGGEIKGSPEVLLEQSATLADEARISFSDAEHEIPSCFYEFARRYPNDSGKLYQGFVAASADQIFSSTNAR